MTALEDLTALVAPLPNASLLTDNMKQKALDASVVPDSFDVWPGEDGYETTYDIYFAALRLVGFLMAQPTVRQSSSEGTSVSVDAPNWSGLLAYYRAESRIIQATQPTGLGVIEIPMHHVTRTDMSGRSDQYGDVDTDLG